MYLFKKEGYLIVEQIDKDLNFEVSTESKLKGCEIEPYLSQPRATDKDGKLRMDLFVFHLTNKFEITKFEEEEIIYLLTNII